MTSTPVPPHDAGARIRVLAKQLYEAMEHPQVAGASFMQTADSSLAYSVVTNTLYELQKAIERRKVSELRALHTALNEALTQYEWQMRRSASLQITEQRKTVARELRASDGRRLYRIAEEIFNLSDNLPTQPDLPSADSRDTALRAIIAVLRTHEFPGTEYLTHHAKEDTSGTQEVEADHTNAVPASAFTSAAGVEVDEDKLAAALGQPKPF